MIEPLGSDVIRATIQNLVKESPGEIIDDVMLWELIDHEIADNQHIINNEYLEIIEKIQKVLDQTEKEKKVISEENQDLINVLEKNSNRIKEISAENDNLQQKLQDVLVELGVMNVRLIEIELKNQVLNAQNAELWLKQNYFDENVAKYDGDVNRDLLKTLDKLISENLMLQKRISSIVSTTNHTEESATYYFGLYNDLLKTYTSLNDDFESLKEERKHLNKSLVEMVDKMKVKQTEIDSFFQYHRSEIECLKLDYAARLRELADGLVNNNEVRITGLDSNPKFGFDISESLVGGLAFEERDKFIKQDSAQLYESIFGIVDNLGSVRSKPKENVDFNHESTDFKKENKTANKKYSIDGEGVIQQIEQQLVDIISKYTAFAETEVLKLFQRRLSFSPDINQNFGLDSAIQMVETILLVQKLMLQDRLAERYMVEVSYNKKIRSLKYKVKLYEEQIKEFNKRVGIISAEIVPPKQKKKPKN